MRSALRCYIDFFVAIGIGAILVEMFQLLLGQNLKSLKAHFIIKRKDYTDCIMIMKLRVK
jgi:hypothetical protein